MERRVFYDIDFDQEDGRRKRKKKEENKWNGSAGNTYSTRTLAKGRRQRRRQKRKRLLLGAGTVCLLLFMLPKAGNFLQRMKESGSQKEIEKLLTAEDAEGEEYPEELLEMLEKNEEVYEFVKGYPDRAAYMGKEIDLTRDCPAGEVPLLLQWDMRWGYDLYGEDMIGIAGCGPACLTMAYLYLTEDLSMNPRKMAEYAYNSGFYTEAGTSWDFFTLGTADLGLTGTELSLSETQMKGALDSGELIICSMRPGDFTTTGHFILLRGYDENGFYVNDPNSRKNSEKQWSFDRLSGQIKCLWRIGK